MVLSAPMAGADTLPIWLPAPEPVFHAQVVPGAVFANARRWPSPLVDDPNTKLAPTTAGALSAPVIGADTPSVQLALAAKAAVYEYK